MVFLVRYSSVLLPTPCPPPCELYELDRSEMKDFYTTYNRLSIELYTFPKPTVALTTKDFGSLLSNIRMDPRSELVSTLGGT